MNWRFFEDGVVRSFDGKNVAARVNTFQDWWFYRTYLPPSKFARLFIHSSDDVNKWMIFTTRVPICNSTRYFFQDEQFKNSETILLLFFFSFHLKNNLVKKLLKRPTMKYPLDEIFLRRGKIYSANIVAKTVCDVCIGVKRLKVIPFQGIVSRARATIHERNVQWKI